MFVSDLCVQEIHEALPGIAMHALNTSSHRILIKKIDMLLLGHSSARLKRKSVQLTFCIVLVVFATENSVAVT